MTTLVIAGSRDLSEDFCYEIIEKFVNAYYPNLKEIVSGGASGPDSAAEKFAKDNNIKFKLFSANWKALGNRAGPLRNKEMAKYASLRESGSLMAIWDGKSRGTSNMISEARYHGLDVRIVHIKQEGEDV